MLKKEIKCGGIQQIVSGINNNLENLEILEISGVIIFFCDIYI